MDIISNAININTRTDTINAGTPREKYAFSVMTAPTSAINGLLKNLRASIKMPPNDLGGNFDLSLYSAPSAILHLYIKNPIKHTLIANGINK